jgi:hypothetical protein
MLHASIVLHVVGSIDKVIPTTTTKDMCFHVSTTDITPNYCPLNVCVMSEYMCKWHDFHEKLLGLAFFIVSGILRPYDVSKSLI